MKVLQLANGYLGNALYRNLFQTLRSAGVENTVYVPMGVNCEETEESADIVPCFTQFDRALFFRKQKKLMRAAEKLYGDMRQFPIIHAHTLFSAGYAAMQWKRRYDIPYIVAVRNTDKNVFFEHMFHLRPIGVRVMREASCVVFLSEAYKESVIETYVPKRYREEMCRKSLVIPNGISTVFLGDRFEPHRLMREKKLRLIYVGELSKNKNLETTVSAAKRLIADGWDITLKVVGEIKDNTYRGLIEGNPFVTYCAKAPQEEVKRHLRQADVFVMPSHTETFGLVYAEAMSQGLPVLYTKGQGFDGHFPDGTVGYAVDDRSPNDVAEKLKLVAEKYDTLADNAYEGAVKFSWDRIAKEYTALYREKAK